MKRHQHGVSDPHALIEQNMALVPLLARKYSNRIVSTNDMILVGFIGLTKAANTFSAGSQLDFFTHTRRCIEREMLTYIKNRHMRSRA